MRKRIWLAPAGQKIRNAVIAAAVVILFFTSISLLNLDIEKFIGRMQNAGTVLGKLMRINPEILPRVGLEMLTTLALALAALAAGVILSLVLSFFAAGNTAPSKLLAAFVKGAVALVRAVPALVWILMIVASIGFGNTSGMIGLMFPTCGFLIKSFVSSIEDLGTDSVEAMRTVGASWPNVILKGVMPGFLSSMITWTAIRMEHNIAESISLGMVGVGGIGAMLTKAMGKYDYGSISTIILVIFITMLLTEFLANHLKKKIHSPN